MGDEIEKLGCGAPDGVSMGRATTEKVSLYGVTPVVQAAHIADMDTSSSDSADYNSCFVKINTLLSDLEDLGILATS